MKRVICVLVAIAAVLFVGGCAFEKTYYYAVSFGGLSFCEEVVTNDTSISDSITTSGFKEGTCAANGYGSTHYCSISGSTGTKTYTINEYYSSSLTDLSTFQAACTGTWH